MSELYLNFFRLQNLPLLTYSINFKSSKNEFLKNETGNNALLLSLDELDDSATRRKVIKKYYSAVFR